MFCRVRKSLQIFSRTAGTDWDGTQEPGVLTGVSVVSVLLNIERDELYGNVEEHFTSSVHGGEWNDLFS